MPEPTWLVELRPGLAVHDWDPRLGPALPGPTIWGSRHGNSEAMNSEPAKKDSANITDADAENGSAAPVDPATPQLPGAAVEPGPTDEGASTEAEQSGSGSAGSPLSDSDAPRPRIQIGSRRRRAESEPQSSKPKTAGTDKPIHPDAARPNVEPVLSTESAAPAAETTSKHVPVPKPSVRDPLSDDLQQQLDAAMADSSLDEMMALGDVPSSAAIEEGTGKRATVIRIHGDDVFFALGGQYEGALSLRQFPEPPAIGTEWDVVVRRYGAEDGLYELTLPGAASQVDDWADVTEGTVVEARITGSNAGGLECQVGSLRAFIPASQIALFRIEDFSEFVDEKWLCVVTEASEQRRNLVLSRRAILEREREEERKSLLDSLEVGQTVEGTVRSLRDFGAFVDLGGVDGLVHISQLSWDRVEHPSEVLSEGQNVRVKIEKVDRQTGKIGLSYRDLLEHPWTNIDQQFPVESVAKGTVTRIAKFGAFVKLAPGIEGLIHISELSHGRVSNVQSVISEGQQVDVKILNVDREAQRIALSMKAVIPEPAGEEPEMESAEDDEELVARRSALAKSSAPLKGGTDRDSGGGQFGLKW